MTKKDQDFEEYCRSLWKEEAERIYDRFGLTATIPERFISSDYSQFNKHELGAFVNNTLLLNSQLPKFDMLLPLLIAKFAFHSSLPSGLLCKEIIDDFSIEYARQVTDDLNLRDLWEDLWSKHSPPQTISTVMHYDPLDNYTWLFSVTGEEGLDALVKELAHLAKNQISISLEDYLLYFMKRGTDFESSLDGTELKIVSQLLENPMISFTSLSQAIDISSEWISRKVGMLKNRRLLYEFERMPFSRIGINMFQVMLEKTESEIDPFSLVKKCPFLFSFRRVLSGPWNSIITLFIPENARSLELAYTGLKLVAAHGYDLSIHRIKSSGAFFSFDFYDSDAGQWDVPWGLLAVHLRRIGLDGLAAAIPRIDTPGSRPSVLLSELDINILDCVRRGINSVSKIRSELKVGQHRVAESLKKLRAADLLTKSWIIRNIGLNEHVVVHEKDADTALAIAAWARRLPKGIISFTDEDNLLLSADLPKGGSFRLASAINAYSTDTRIGVLSTKVYGTYGFSVSWWNHKIQNWRCPEEQLEDWISDLR